MPRTEDRKPEVTTLELEPMADRLVHTLGRLRPRLKQILWSFRLQPEEAEDIIQGVVIVALEHLKRTKIEDLDAWIIVTLRYQCLMFFRKEEARLRREKVWTELLEAHREVSRESDPSWVLRSSFPTLPRRYRLILQLRLAGHTSLEVAAITGYSIHVVRKLNLLAVRRLRGLLAAGTLVKRPTRRSPVEEEPAHASS